MSRLGRDLPRTAAARAADRRRAPGRALGVRLRLAAARPAGQEPRLLRRPQQHRRATSSSSPSASCCCRRWSARPGGPGRGIQPDRLPGAPPDPGRGDGRGLLRRGREADLHQPDRADHPRRARLRRRRRLRPAAGRVSYPSLLDVLAVAPVVFLVIFFFFSDTSKLILPQSNASALGVRVPSKTPVVEVIFDEFPTATLLDGQRPDRRPALPPLRRAGPAVHLVPEQHHGRRLHRSRRARDHDRQQPERQHPADRLGPAEQHLQPARRRLPPPRQGGGHPGLSRRRCAARCSDPASSPG